MIFISASGFAGTIKGTVTAKSIRSAKDAVIYVRDIESSSSPGHAVMDQKGLTFIPHVLPVLKGTTVDFLNSDTVAHNVFSPSETADRFNLGTWQRGTVKSYTFNKTGVAEILCNLHPEMSACILVLSNPYFAKAGKGGRFIIEDVPSGSYTLYLWHERVKTQSKDITVNGETEVNFEL